MLDARRFQPVEPLRRSARRGGRAPPPDHGRAAAARAARAADGLGRRRRRRERRRPRVGRAALRGASTRTWRPSRRAPRRRAPRTPRRRIAAAFDAAPDPLRRAADLLGLLEFLAYAHGSTTETDRVDVVDAVRLTAPADASRSAASRSARRTRPMTDATTVEDVPAAQDGTVDLPDADLPDVDPPEPGRPRRLHRARTDGGGPREPVRGRRWGRSTPTCAACSCGCCSAGSSSPIATARRRTLLENQQVIESRLHDLVHLVVDHDRGIAYKRQVRSAGTSTCRRCCATTRTRAPRRSSLVHLRTVFQRERGAGETSVRVDVEEIEQTALTYFDPDDTNVASHQREIRAAVARLAKEGLIEEESEGRFRVTPLVEVVLSNERLSEMRAWLAEQVRVAGRTSDDDGRHAVRADPRGVDGSAVGRARPAYRQLGRLRRPPPCGSRRPRRCCRRPGVGQVDAHGRVHRAAHADTTPFNGASNGGVRPAARQGPAQHPVLRARQFRRVAHRRGQHPAARAARRRARHVGDRDDGTDQGGTDFTAVRAWYVPSAARTLEEVVAVRATRELVTDLSTLETPRTGSPACSPRPA